MEPVAHHLIFHAAVVLLFGLLCGVPYARAINCKAPEKIVHAWRVAHLALPLGAALMLAVAAVISFLAVAPQVKWLISVSLIISSCAFCISLPLVAVTGFRGLSGKGTALAKFVYAGNMLGAWSSLCTAVVFLYAAFVSL